MTGSDHVVAMIGGERVELRIGPDEIVALELTIGGSAFVLMQKFVTGLWSIDEMKTVIAFAALPVHQRTYLCRAAGFGIDLSQIYLGHHRIGTTPAIDRLLDGDPAGSHAIVALRLLESALYGLSSVESDLTRLVSGDDHHGE